MFSLNTEVEIPETSEVRFIDTELEKLDYSKLYGGLRQKGRKSAVNAKTMFKVIVYAYERGIYSSRKIEEACRVRIDFRWLLNGEKIPDHCAISRFRKKHKEELEDFFCQYVRILEAEEETDHEVVFIDGTKVESRAGRYTFVWRGRVEKDLAKAKAKLYETTGTEDVAEAEAKVTELVSGLIFVTGKGHHKSERQKEAENILELLERIHRYEKDLEIM